MFNIDVNRLVSNPLAHNSMTLPFAVGMSQNQPSGSATYGGSNYIQSMMQNAPAQREADLEKGYAKGREIFYNNPDMQMMREKRMSLANGYDSGELGAMREGARSELAGQRTNYLRSLASRVGKAGVGGARAAAMGASADKGFLQTRGDQERKMALDNAQLKRQGTTDLENFLMRQRFGELSTGLGYGQMGVADRTGAMQAQSAQNAAEIAGREPQRGILGQMMAGLF